MAEERVQRRLAAILAADVVGYSKLIEADEEGTRSRLRRLQTELISEKISTDGGRIVKTMGDGFLIEFSSAVDAVRSALAIQSTIADRNVDVPEERRIILRMGVNLGDVLVEDDDIHGDGVNVAARLEGLCEPGEIYVSSSVYDQVSGKIEATFEDLGEKTVKNISRPIRIYRVGKRAMTLAGGALHTDILPLPDKPSIAVLPFDNLSGDPEQEYFADGVAEDIITALSRFSWFFVIARNSSFSYKGASPDIRRVAKELGVQYVLEGSVRKAGNRVRITGQLIDALTGRHVWAERYDRELDDIFAVQDEVSAAITGAIAPEFLSAERKRAERKAPDNLLAWDYALRGNWNLWKSGRERLAEAKKLFRTAIDLDERCSIALCGIAHICNLEILNGWADDIDANRQRGFEAAQQATFVDENDAWAHATLGWVYHVMRRSSDARRELERALELNPNLAFAEGTLSLALAHQGKYDEAVEHSEMAVRLSPHDQAASTWIIARVIAPLVTGRFEEYREWAQKITEINPASPLGWRHLAAANAYLEKMDEARTALARLKEITPEDSLSRMKEYVPSTRPELLDRLIEGLRKAGMPE